MRSPKRIGIVGGGQLGRMLTHDAQRLGFEVAVLDETLDCPATQFGADHLVGKLTDKDAIKRLAEISTYLTFEIEHINTDELRKLVANDNGVKINPSPTTLALIKDKFMQKQALDLAGIPVAPFAEVKTEEDILEVAKQFGYPMILKTRFGGYDGRGNVVIKNESQIKSSLEKLVEKPLYVEKCIRFKKELAVIAARDVRGNVVTYPLVETIHENNICHTVIAPAPVDQSIAEDAYKLARETLKYLEGAGVFGIEMFLTEDNLVLVNEIAPRVHNSGHYTIEACSTSQFEQHIRAVTGLPLGSTRMHTKAAVMVNILGDRKGRAELKGLEEALTLPHVAIHIYGKAETKPERKMGHITVCADTIEAAKQYAKLARQLISI